jgi:SAM-dependent methyltransferase
MSFSLPFPPSALRERVFAAEEPADSTATYEAVGRGVASAVERSLPPDWSWDGKRVLDFACGAGRVLRHLRSGHPGVEWWGCDVHRPSIEWLQSASGGSVHAFVNEPEPPLPLEDDQFDLVYGISAFTHLGWNWARWLAEMHRILRPGGLLIVSLLGPNLQDRILGQVLDPNLFGILVMGHGLAPEENGPVVFQSEWWLRAHWGRAFEIIEFRPDDFVVGQMHDGPAHLQSMLVARAQAVEVSEDVLRAPELGDPREAIGLAVALAQTVAELESALLRPPGRS